MDSIPSSSEKSRLNVSAGEFRQKRSPFDDEESQLRINNCYSLPSSAKDSLRCEVDTTETEASLTRTEDTDDEMLDFYVTMTEEEMELDLHSDKTIYENSRNLTMTRCGSPRPDYYYPSIEEEEQNAELPGIEKVPKTRAGETNMDTNVNEAAAPKVTKVRRRTPLVAKIEGVPKAKAKESLLPKSVEEEEENILEDAPENRCVCYGLVKAMMIELINSDKNAFGEELKNPLATRKPTEWVSIPREVYERLCHPRMKKRSSGSSSRRKERRQPSVLTKEVDAGNEQEQWKLKMEA